MAYVDGFVVPVPKSKLAAYRKLAQRTSKIWREHGALEYVECVGDDTPYGKRALFPRSVKLRDGETGLRLDRVQIPKGPRPYQ